MFVKDRSGTSAATWQCNDYNDKAIQKEFMFLGSKNSPPTRLWAHDVADPKYYRIDNIWTSSWGELPF